MCETNSEKIESKTDWIEAPETNVIKEPFKFNEYTSKEKPTHVKPAFYAFLYESLKVIAKEHGYNLLLNGSMHRDLDLIAVPWVNEPKDEYEMIKLFDFEINGFYQEIFQGGEKVDMNSVRYKQAVYLFSVLPGGRNSYVININRSGEWNNYTDAQYYLDISVTPLLKKDNSQK